MEAGELKPATLKQKLNPLKVFTEHFGGLLLNNITALHITRIMDATRQDGRVRPKSRACHITKCNVSV